MQDGQGQDTVLRVAEEAADARRADFAGLQVEQGRDHLQIVFDPVMDLAKHVVALLQAGIELAFAIGDRRSHLPDTLGDRRHLRRPGLRRNELDLLASSHAAGEFLDVAERTQAPPLRAEPHRGQHEKQGQDDHREQAPVGQQG